MSEQTEQTEQAKGTAADGGDPCPTPPKLEKEVPSIPDLKGQVPPHKLKELQAALNKANRNIAEKYGMAEQQAQEVKDKAEAVYRLAEKKYASDKKVLETKISNAKNDLWSDYDQKVDSSSGSIVPDRDKAVYIAQLNKGLADQDAEFQKGTQKIEKAKSSADADWDKAQADFTFSICVAKAEKAQAEKDAEVKFHTDLSQALKSI